MECVSQNSSIRVVLSAPHTVSVAVLTAFVVPDYDKATVFCVCTIRVSLCRRCRIDITLVTLFGACVVEELVVDLTITVIEVDPADYAFAVDEGSYSGIFLMSLSVSIDKNICEWRRSHRNPE